jgi:hypothetical protein
MSETRDARRIVAAAATTAVPVVRPVAVDDALAWARSAAPGWSLRDDDAAARTGGPSAPVVAAPLTARPTAIVAMKATAATPA